ncbi:MAG: hypothetical protein AAFR16_09600 [Pseudomonadota bacterium]
MLDEMDLGRELGEMKARIQALEAWRGQSERDGPLTGRALIDRLERLVIASAAIWAMWAAGLLESLQWLGPILSALR